MRYAHTLLFICPACNLPCSVSRVTDLKNLEPIEDIQLRLKCQYCQKSSEVNGFMAKSHWVTEWDDSTEPVTRQLNRMEHFAPIDESIDHSSRDGNGGVFLHTLVFECPGCQLPVVVGRLSTHAERERISGEAQNISCAFCEESFRAIVVTAKEHHVAAWINNALPMFGVSKSEL